MNKDIQHEVGLNKIYLNKFLGVCLFIFSFIPWVSFGLNNLDSQPWPFIFAILFLLGLKKITLPRYSIHIFFLVVIGFFFIYLFTNSIENFYILRALVNYLSLPLFYICYYNYFLRYGFPLRIFIFFNIFWIVFGIIELFIPEISVLITKLRTDSSRGVTSLANEATDFGIYLFFSSLIVVNLNYLLKQNQINKLLIINFLSVLFLAKSSMVMLFYIICISFFLMFKFYYTILDKKIIKKNLINVLFLILLFLVIFSLFKDLLLNTRIYYLTNRLVNEQSIMKIVITDWSINSRVESVYFSIVGSFKNLLLPGGLDSFIEMRKEILSSMQTENFYNRVESNKIMSWIGALSYELGIFGLIIIYLFFLASYRDYRGSILYSFTLFIVLFSAIPVAFPLVSMLFTLMVYKKNYNLYK